jgi:hypothetical protein
VARSLRFTVPREPIELEIGGEVFTAPPILAPTTLAELMDKQAEIQDAFSNITTQAQVGERGVIDTVLKVLARRPTDSEDDGTGIFDLVFTDEETAQRFRERLHSRDRPFDLLQEVMPAVRALIEEYTGRPTQPSPPSASGSDDGGTTSTDGAPAAASTPSPSALTAS